MHNKKIKSRVKLIESLQISWYNEYVYLCNLFIMKKSSGLMEALNLPIVKRKAICLVLGIAFWFLSAYILWSNIVILQKGYDFWGSTVMWNFVFNGFLIWIVVFITWVFTIHPVFKFRFYPEIRGALMWGLVSIDIAMVAFGLDIVAPWRIFTAIVLWWIAYGIVIDFVATAFGWEGEDLLKRIK